MGKIAFFMLLITAVVLSIIFAVVYRLLKKKDCEMKERVEEKKPVTSSKEGLFNGYGWHMVLGALAILTYFYGPTAYEGWNSWSQSRIITRQAMPVVNYQPQQQEQHGTLTWVMPEGVTGINASQPSVSMEAVITRNDHDVMEFSTPGETKFHWDKTNKYGEWHDAKGASGQWRLTLEEGGGSYKGEESDNMGTFIPLRLVLH